MESGRTFRENCSSLGVHRIQHKFYHKPYIIKPYSEYSDQFRTLSKDVKLVTYAFKFIFHPE